MNLSCSESTFFAPTPPLPEDLQSRLSNAYSTLDKVKRSYRGALIALTILVAVLSLACGVLLSMWHNAATSKQLIADQIVGIWNSTQYSADIDSPYVSDSSITVVVTKDHRFEIYSDSKLVVSGQWVYSHVSNSLGAPIYYYHFLHDNRVTSYFIVDFSHSSYGVGYLYFGDISVEDIDLSLVREWILNRTELDPASYWRRGA